MLFYCISPLNILSVSSANNQNYAGKNVLKESSIQNVSLNQNQYDYQKRRRSSSFSFYSKSQSNQPNLNRIMQDGFEKSRNHDYRKKNKNNRFVSYPNPHNNSKSSSFSSSRSISCFDAFYDRQSCCLQNDSELRAENYQAFRFKNKYGQVHSSCAAAAKPNSNHHRRNKTKKSESNDVENAQETSFDWISICCNIVLNLFS